MFDRFTDRARKVLGYSHQEAERLRHDYIGTEHILLGLVKEGSGVAANVLENLDVDLDLDKVRAEVEKRVEHGTKEKHDQLPFDRDGHKALDYAIEEARELGHKYVGTEHLLLGLLRAEDSTAVKVLVSLDIKLADVRREVIELLGMAPQDAVAWTVKQCVERLAQLENDRLAAVKVQDFERAASLRNEAEKLREVVEKLREEPPKELSSRVAPRVLKALEYAKEEAIREGSASITLDHLRRAIERAEKKGAEGGEDKKD